MDRRSFLRGVGVLGLTHLLNPLWTQLIPETGVDPWQDLANASTTTLTLSQMDALIRKLYLPNIMENLYRESPLLKAVGYYDRST